MKLCVGSVFAADDDMGRMWLDLQLKFLQATTSNFERVVTVWGGDQTGHFLESCDHVIAPVGDPTGAGECHLWGLQHLTAYFKERQKNFDYFLYLDCDAFPIMVGWLPELAAQMQEQAVFQDGMFSRMTGRNYDIAAAVRSENLERRLHASALLVKQEALPNVSIEASLIGIDLIGNVESDIHLPEYEGRLKDRAYAMMRSNKINLHPLACGVYYNMFYHHGCGARLAMKVRGYKKTNAQAYWGPFDLDTTLTVDYFTKQLTDDPAGFVSHLAGWTPRRYAVLS